MNYLKTILTLPFIFAASCLQADETVDFNRQIRPLLSQHCYTCHGPDENVREAALRLDVFDGGLDRVVDADSPDDSELLIRVREADSDFRMPPPEHGKGLRPEEIELIRTWIASGAEFNRHWSYQTPVRPVIAAIDSNWPINDIDRLTLPTMIDRGLEPSVPADKEILIRRVALDLTGLPPSDSDVATFLNDDSPEAYEKLVDQLLDRKSFGERWAALWLDHARYADTMGYAEDRPRTIWAYRDYVIRSFNANKPFDQFTIEQLAGDLLSNPTEEQLVATAFHRNTLTNTEGGTIDEEFRSAAVVDRVNTTMAVWMGTTIACAQCHTHKYDPITQKEYYQLYAFFNNTADNDQPNERPVHEIYSAKRRQRIKDLKRQLRECLQQRESWTSLSKDQRRKRLQPQQQEWERKVAANDATVGQASFVRIELQGQQKILSLAEVQIFVDGQNVAAEGEASQSSTGYGGTAQRAIDGNTNGNYPVSNSVTHTETESSPWWELQLEMPEQIEKIVVWHRTDNNLYRRSNGMIIRLLDANCQTLWSSTLDTVDREADTLAISGVPEEILRIVQKHQRSEQESSTLAVYFENKLGPLKQHDLEIARLNREIDSIRSTTSVPIMKELEGEQRRSTQIHRRGSYLDPGEQVQCGTPATFHPIDSSLPNRLTLAHWLVSKENPMTARVIVNRFWQQLFGTGIVPTLEEFGAQGELPSHPELLDYLACEFMDSGWDVKSVLKQIVMSATYRQSSAVSERKAAVDPNNVWLARGPRSRLSAEMIRDQALAASGLLSSKMYGPPVQPPQPKLGLKKAFRGDSADWENDTGEDRYRRAIYTRWQRSSPYPSLTTFDVSNREVCELGRLTTNTPLQALVTLNDPAFVEAAQAMARNAVSVKDASIAASQLFRSVLVRTPSKQELEVLTKLFHETVGHFKEDRQAAEQLGVDPLNPPDEATDKIRLAAWTTVANVILNLDEAMTKR